MKRGRNSLSYKIKMWYYRLTFQDVKKAFNVFKEFMFGFIIAILGFILLFIFPAFFH